MFKKIELEKLERKYHFIRVQDLQQNIIKLQVIQFSQQYTDYKSTMQQKTQQTLENQAGKVEQNPSVEQTEKKQQKGTEKLVRIYEQKQKQLIQSIREIQNSQVQLELNEQLTEEIKEENKNKILAIAQKVVVAQKYLQFADKYEQDEKQNQTYQFYLNKIEQQVKDYKPTQQEILARFNELILQPNDSNWTDATQSQADDDQIWAVDEDIMRAMEEQEDIDEQEQYMKENQGEQNKKQQINYEQLEEQFVVGNQSDHQLLFGKHDKFCVSVNGLIKQSLLFSGGGDDYLHLYKLPQQQADPSKCLAPYHIVKHTETVNKIQISYSKQFIFSMTDNEILCTQIKTLQTTKLKVKETVKQQKKQQQSKKQQNSDDEEQPLCSDMVCHHLGDVVALSSGFELQIYNVKGLKLYQTYYCQRAIDMIAFTETGKQIVLACDDNKLRLLTPKTSQIVTVAGVKQHQSQISVLKTKGDFVLTGCIDGYIGVTSLKKATLTTLIGVKQTEDVDGAINNLQFAGNYFISGSLSDRIDWYDFGKCKKLFQSTIQGSSSDICWQGTSYQHLYNVSTIKGYIHLFDCRNPLKQINKTRAGNTIHKLWADGHHVISACQDGHVRLFDIRKLI